jgi:hypothetical protein
MKYYQMEVIMKQILETTLVALTLGAVLATTSAAASAEPPGGETRAVDANVSKVVLSGVASLQLRWGSTPALIVFAAPSDLKQLTTVQHGDVLEIDTEGLYTHSPHIRVELTLPSLSQFSSSGTGAATLTGFGGDELQLNSSGTGNITATLHYKRLVARSSGVAGMNLNDGDSDSVEVSLPGAGHVTLAGQTKNFTGRLDGVGSLDAAELKADTVNAYLNGVGSVKVYAKQAANVYLHGVGSATVYGKPANRNAEVSGFGKITWE